MSDSLLYSVTTCIGNKDLTKRNSLKMHCTLFSDNGKLHCGNPSGGTTGHSNFHISKCDFIWLQDMHTKGVDNAICSSQFIFISIVAAQLARTPQRSATSLLLSFCFFGPII